MTVAAARVSGFEFCDLFTTVFPCWDYTQQEQNENVMVHRSGFEPALDVMVSRR
jgi:hypothetical protein